MCKRILPIAITSGEPAGIGLDICLDLPSQKWAFPLVILADKNVLNERAKQLGKPPILADYDPHNLQAISVWHHSIYQNVQAGYLNPDNAKYVLSLLDTAHDGVMKGIFSAMVTAPVHKGVINDGGIAFTGHTEYLAYKSGVKKVVMMLAGGGLRVALVTTHLPLKDVPKAVTSHELSETIKILAHDLQYKFGISTPRIAVTGLNPHAGEGGHLGHEEQDIIIPILNQLRQLGLHIDGPYPADTIFQPAIIENHDVILAMYHDQGLPVLKYAGFGAGINITLGLPYIRTSVDHGTALDLAGTGRASSSSLFVATHTAIELSKNYIKS